MSINSQARTAYSNVASPVRTGRNSEYAIFAKITHKLKDVDEADKSAYPRLAAAVCENQRLWGALFEDLVHEGNGLPVPLKAQLIGLAEFVRKHTTKVLSGKASVLPLIDINTSIMRGLRGELEASAS